MGTGGGSPEFMAFFFNLGMMHTCNHGTGDATGRHRELASQPASLTYRGEFQTVRDLVSKHEVGRGVHWGYMGGSLSE